MQGDAFLGATNLVEDQPADFVKRMAKFSIDAVKAANETLIDPENSTLGSVSIRCGFHVGPVVGRVVGTSSLRNSCAVCTPNVTLANRYTYSQVFSLWRHGKWGIPNGKSLSTWQNSML